MIVGVMYRCIKVPPGWDNIFIPGSLYKLIDYDEWQGSVEIQISDKMNVNWKVTTFQECFEPEHKAFEDKLEGLLND